MNRCEGGEGRGGFRGRTAGGKETGAGRVGEGGGEREGGETGVGVEKSDKARSASGDKPIVAA